MAYERVSEGSIAAMVIVLIPREQLSLKTVQLPMILRREPGLPTGEDAGRGGQHEE